MIGNNKLELCEAEMMVALQEYLDKRMRTFAPKVVGVSQDKSSGVFTIELKSKELPQ